MNKNPESSAGEDAQAQRVANSLEKIAANLGSPQALSETERSKYRLDFISACGLWSATIAAVAAIVISSRDAREGRAELERQLGEMKVQRTVMQSQINEMAAEQRPWLSVDKVTVYGAYGHDDDQFTATLGISVKNSGHAPATKVAVVGEWLDDDIYVRDYRANPKMRKLCKEERSFGPSTLFDQLKSGSYEVPVSTSRRAISELLSDKADVPYNTYSNGGGVIIYCISYSSTGRKERYWTIGNIWLKPVQPSTIRAKRQLLETRAKFNSQPNKEIYLEDGQLRVEEFNDGEYAD